jgi:hypothetical protein
MDARIQRHPERFEASGASAARLNFEVVDVRSGPAAGARYGLRMPIWHQ